MRVILRVRSCNRTFACSACGAPLLRELDGLWEFRVHRFRIVYTTDQALGPFAHGGGHRKFIYEELTARLRKNSEPAT